MDLVKQAAKITPASPKNINRGHNKAK